MAWAFGTRFLPLVAEVAAGEGQVRAPAAHGGGERSDAELGPLVLPARRPTQEATKRASASGASRFGEELRGEGWTYDKADGLTDFSAFDLRLAEWPLAGAAEGVEGLSACVGREALSELVRID